MRKRAGLTLGHRLRSRRDLHDVRIASQSFNSFAIFDAMFLKPIDVPEIRLKRTPFSDRRGSLQTSISHWTRESVLGSPCTHNSRNFSRCSKPQLFLLNTFRISCMMSFGSREDVVFMLHVNLKERGFTESSLFGDL